ncbi:MAG: ABC transporter substrate-binding protein [Candidatus Accumulibacter sp.]|jgi:peptide/nickel transport system substrate-binding protein|nr:ABC transporter substrate-binding protein [Accumulibacter sp.]
MLKKTSLTATVAAIALLCAQPLWASGDTLVVSQNTVATTLHPLALTMTPEQSIASNIYDGLVDRDHEGKLVPSLATSWSRDGNVWRFALRKGVKWHNGDSFSADDVIYTFQLAETPINRYKFINEKIAAVRKIDDYTVEIETKRPWALLADALYNTIIVMPRFFKDKSEAYIAENPLGTGPYKFVEWVRGSHMNLVAFEDHWRGAPSIKKVSFRPINNDATRLAGLMSGTVDLTTEVPVQNVDTAKNNKNLTVTTRPSALSVFFLVRTDKPELPTAKREVRLAIQHAINMDEIVKTILSGQSKPATQLPAPFFRGFNPDLKRPEYDPEKARKLLAAAGYPDGFEITLNCTQDRYVMDKDLCLAVTQQLSKVKIKVNLVAQTAAVHFKELRQQKYDFMLMGWNETTFDSSRFLGEFLKTKGVWNGGGVSDPKLDAMLEESDIIPDQNGRAAKLREINGYVVEQALAFPLHYPLDIYGVNNRVKGFVPNVKKILTLRELSFQ